MGDGAPTGIRAFAGAPAPGIAVAVVRRIDIHDRSTGGTVLRIPKDPPEGVGSGRADEGEDVAIQRLGLTVGREIATQRRGTIQQNRGWGLLGCQDQTDSLVDGQFAGIIFRITRDAGDLGIVQVSGVGWDDFLQGTLDLERLSKGWLVLGGGVGV